MQLSLGMFFLLQGVLGILDYDSSFSRIQRSIQNTLGRQTIPWDLIIDVGQLLAGLVLIVLLFFHPKRPRGFQFLLGLVLSALWGLLIVLNNFAQGFLEPSLLVWMGKLSYDLVILTALLAIAKR